VQRSGARFKPALQHAAAECLADLPEARMQRPQRDADMIGSVLRRKIGIMKIVPANARCAKRDVTGTELNQLLVAAAGPTSEHDRHLGVFHKSRNFRANPAFTEPTRPMSS
jgi:hypothetical protein